MDARHFFASSVRRQTRKASSKLLHAVPSRRVSSQSYPMEKVLTMLLGGELRWYKLCDWAGQIYLFCNSLESMLFLSFGRLPEQVRRTSFNIAISSFTTCLLQDK